jgi:hypothetical protein
MRMTAVSFEASANPRTIAATNQRNNDGRCQNALRLSTQARKVAAATTSVVATDEKASKLGEKAKRVMTII